METQPEDERTWTLRRAVDDRLHAVDTTIADAELRDDRATRLRPGVLHPQG
jgi:hypothetical protein